MKNNRKFQTENYSKQDEFMNDYEDYGLNVQNAKRYTSRTKRQAKFKEYDDSDWSS
jgi:hypothetical protein